MFVPSSKSDPRPSSNGNLPPRSATPLPWPTTGRSDNQYMPLSPLDSRHDPEQPDEAVPVQQEAAIRPPRHTPGCLAQRLKELQPRLESCFPAFAADCGLSAALKAGMRYIKRVEEREAPELDDGAAYLRVVAFRAARRCQGRELKRAPLAATENIPARPEYVEEPASGLAYVRDAVNALPPRQKEAVMLRFVSGYSIRATAREMGITHQTARVYLKLASARLFEIVASSLPS